jgi:hypothetical protein
MHATSVHLLKTFGQIFFVQQKNSIFNSYVAASPMHQSLKLQNPW